MSVLPTRPTRGERNNNPGNIDRTKDKWQGMADDQSGDPRFVVFKTPQYGIRALARLLLNYEKKGQNTVRKIVERWAPPVENNTYSYIAAVCRDVYVGPDDVIDLDDFDIMFPLVRAIIRHENGRVIYSDEVIQEGIRMAGVHNAPAVVRPLMKQPAFVGTAAAIVLGAPALITQVIEALTPLTPAYPAAAKLIELLGHLNVAAAVVVAVALAIQNKQAKQ